MSMAPQVVGIIHSMKGLKDATRIRPGDLDFLEIRVDSFLGREEAVVAALPRLKLPLIITVRHSSEGGAQPATTANRRKSFRKFLPFATFIDIELRSVRALADVLGAAREAKVGTILSYHNFRTTPSDRELRGIVTASAAAKGDILKIATATSTPADLARLLSLPCRFPGLRFSAMGMGRFGKVSRLLLAVSGSVLNYGFLGEPQVNGQWPAALLKKRIRELVEP